MKPGAQLLCLLLAAPMLAQNESQLAADFRHEGENFQASCLNPAFNFGYIGGCAQLLFTDHPLHIAAGSLAPGNGFGFGPAFVAHYTPNENWRLSWNADAVATPNGSWRAGTYMTAVLIRHSVITPSTSEAAKTHRTLTVDEMPVFHVYAENTSLNKVTYFGLGQGTPNSARSYFGIRETIAGGNVVWPIWKPLNVSLFGEANGRFVALSGNHGQTSPSIEQLYTEATAPGLTDQPAFAQFGEGIRVRPSFAKGYIRLNYSLAFQEWVAGNSSYSFRRFTADLSHQFPLYRRTRSLLPKEFNGPDSCSQDVNAPSCAPISRNLEGSFGLRFLYTGSYVPQGHAVPFYFDPTVGGSDINGTALLPSYPDYRFRGPNLLLLRGSFEHSIYKWPIGVKFMVDEGRVAITRGDLGWNHLAHSYAAGLTVHAGGLPVIDLLFAWGGHEGTHTIANVSSSLLGGTSRPSLY